jgi:hypothetical protein
LAEFPELGSAAALPPPCPPTDPRRSSLSFFSYSAFSSVICILAMSFRVELELWVEVEVGVEATADAEINRPSAEKKIDNVDMDDLNL